MLFSVMTWNLYLGADLTPIFTAAPEQIPERITEVFRQFLATSFPRRAKAIARQISMVQPDIIGLQESVLVELIPPDSHNVVYDFTDILLKELEYRGLHYIIAIQNQTASTVRPDSSGNTVSFTDRNAILIRKERKVEVINTLSNNFTANYEITLGDQPFVSIRGWSYVDANINGQIFRIVNNHLEPLSSDVQVAQADELLAGPGVTNLPLIFIGDYNSNASGNSTPTYGNLIAAGFQDTWLTAGNGSGFTAHQSSDLLNAESELNERVDLILIKNKDSFSAVKDILVGEKQSDRTYTRLWPSDHAGVAAKFRLQNL